MQTGHALEAALKAVEAVAARPFPVDGIAPVRISAGVVPLQPERNATQILRAADEACLRAKRAGGGTVAGPETG